jgi:hypothetical protein
MGLRAGLRPRSMQVQPCPGGCAFGHSETTWTQCAFGGIDRDGCGCLGHCGLVDRPRAWLGSSRRMDFDANPHASAHCPIADEWRIGRPGIFVWPGGRIHPSELPTVERAVGVGPGQRDRVGYRPTGGSSDRSMDRQLSRRQWFRSLGRILADRDGRSGRRTRWASLLQVGGGKGQGPEGNPSHLGLDPVRKELALIRARERVVVRPWCGQEIPASLRSR